MENEMKEDLNRRRAYIAKTVDKIQHHGKERTYIDAETNAYFDMVDEAITTLSWIVEALTTIILDQSENKETE